MVQGPGRSDYGFWFRVFGVVVVLLLRFGFTIWGRGYVFLSPS